MFGMRDSKKERRTGSSSFGRDDSNHSMISHRSIHDEKHNKNIHSSIHDHGKIHESMHLGKDRISNPFSKKR